MVCVREFRRAIGWLIFPVLLATPVLAHTVKVSGDVAATFHIEPNHNPKAGVPSQAWFGLTRKGGSTIPLSQCNCRLAVYAVPRASNASPVLQPTLKAVNASTFKGVPGADIVFPKAGEYELRLSGTAKAPATFRSFQLNYSVTVGG
ncbi:MAG: hypothetical protein KME42_15785 [Tildeniella nuda ZEHNDER 1965/U140]|jgi:hypothetical protein|nr:hypothetical protein [Tildeniella nuda ZEHNDER 1965/U140]